MRDIICQSCQGSLSYTKIVLSRIGSSSLFETPGRSALASERVRGLHGSLAHSSHASLARAKAGTTTKHPVDEYSLLPVHIHVACDMPINYLWVWRCMVLCACALCRILDRAPPIHDHNNKYCFFMTVQLVICGQCNMYAIAMGAGAAT